MIVADANLLVYLYVRGGALTDRADAAYRHDADWAAPYLWRSEVRNALARMIRDSKITMDEACAALVDAETLLKDQEYLVASPDVLALAIQSGCTAYDCEYVALAEALNVPLVTEDREVLRAFPARAVSPEQFVKIG
ncbi:MAG: type II toxin-antitoxin system VapC family toxin [candidate division NC10 bacterium]|nr:type II toxin-antitoxin system VapC family toxin [candidate division NC10 bacterium]